MPFFHTLLRLCHAIADFAFIDADTYAFAALSLDSLSLLITPLIAMLRFDTLFATLSLTSPVYYRR